MSIVAALGGLLFVIVYSPMGSGMLTGKMTRERIAQLADDDWRKHDERFNEPQLSQNLELVERLAAVADRRGSTEIQRRTR